MKPTPHHTLLFRLIGPMQSWGYRSRFEDRDTGLEPTRSGVFGLLASACGISREDTATLTEWDSALRFGIRIETPAKTRWDGSKIAPSGFRIESDFHTAQDVLRAAGKGKAETVLSTRHYLTDARYTVGLESSDWELLRRLETALKNPVWTLSLGRKAFPLSVPPWLPSGGLRENTSLYDALKIAPWLLLSDCETKPDTVRFVVEPGDEPLPEGLTMRLTDRPLDFSKRDFGIRDTRLFEASTAACGMEVDRCFCQK